MLSRWPTRSFFRPSDLDSMFRLLDVPAANSAPPVHITQDEDKFVLRAELPGMKPEEISISAEKNLLTISGNRSIVRDKKIVYRRRERIGGAFERTFVLPHPFDLEKIEAGYTDGILTVTLPKSAETKPRAIAVKGGGS